MWGAFFATVWGGYLSKRTEGNGFLAALFVVALVVFAVVELVQAVLS